MRRRSLVLLAVLSLCGCVVREPGDVVSMAGSNPPPRMHDDAWPKRYAPPDVFDDRCEVALLAPPRGAPPEERTPIGSAGLGTLWRIDVEKLADPRDLAQLREKRGFREWLVFQTYLGWAETTLAMVPPREIGPETPRSPVRIVEISETSFAIYLPDGPPRGLVVQMTNLAGNTEWERKLTEEFRARGWAVLSTFVPDGWAFGEYLQLDRDDDPAVLGERIAAAIDDRFAEWAYGVEAVLDYMRSEYPEVPQAPMVGLGSSAGAIALPAVAARLSRPFSATVVIGGGIDALRILRTTTLAATPLHLDWKDERRPTDAQWDAIQAAYLEHTNLDGAKTAPYLRDHPVLMLQGAWDRIVDSRCGDALWEALGRPERWTYQAGHLGLFFFWLPMETGKIGAWVDAKVGAVPAPRP
ncbi:MAG: hypothetical protein U0575_10980 [Phycisphaerales bacterium]